jgi:hypothetical protein
MARIQNAADLMQNIITSETEFSLKFLIQKKD